MAFPDLDMTYGIHGKAAPWKDLTGGAEQIVTPFDGITLEKLKMLGE